MHEPVEILASQDFGFEPTLGAVIECEQGLVNLIFPCSMVFKYAFL